MNGFHSCCIDAIPWCQGPLPLAQASAPQKYSRIIFKDIQRQHISKLSCTALVRSMLPRGAKNRAH